jgi:glycosyltransferase involved in cell wall biosynthesis
MLIVHLITGLDVGGAENQLLELVQASNGSGFRHAVVSLLEVGPIASELRAADVEVYTLGMKTALRSPAGLLRLSLLLRRLKPDVLHCWLYHACLAGLIGGKLAGVGRIIWGLRAANRNLGFSRLTRAVIRACARLSAVPDVMVVNSEAGKAAHAWWGYKTANMRVVPNGVDPRRFHPDSEARSSVCQELGLAADSVLIGRFGRYDPMKDHETFLRAAGLVRPTCPNARFLLAGEGITASNAALQQMVEKNNLQEAAVLLGARRDVPRLTAALDIACLSSWTESFPNVVAEAMACAVPCVVTDTGDAKLIVDGTGIAVPPSDPQVMADAMLNLIADPVRRATLGKSARERVVSKFSLQAMVESYQEIYTELGAREIARAESIGGQ